MVYWRISGKVEFFRTVLWANLSGGRETLGGWEMMRATYCELV